MWTRGSGLRSSAQRITIRYGEGETWQFSSRRNRLSSGQRPDMRGSSVISALKKKLRVSTDKALANQLGMSLPAIHNWKNTASVTERQIVGLVDCAIKSGAKHAQSVAIRPLVEFIRIERCESRHGARYEVFSDKHDDGGEHPYRTGLKAQLDKLRGVHVFFDSRGRAIYVGKAKQLSLWTEINNAFNRDRGEVQKIKRVRHPERRQQYRTSDEKARQITHNLVPLHELAHISAHTQVADQMSDDLEALLARSFASDLLNIRMEQFSRTMRLPLRRGMALPGRLVALDIRDRNLHSSTLPRHPKRVVCRSPECRLLPVLPP